MGNAFRLPTPPTPQEDPAVRAAREREEQRAEQDRQRALQAQLRSETRLSGRGGRQGPASLLTRGTAGFAGLRALLGGG